MIVIYILATIGAFTVMGWIREHWRTRHDTGYNANRWGAF